MTAHDYLVQGIYVVLGFAGVFGVRELFGRFVDKRPAANKRKSKN